MGIKIVSKRQRASSGLSLSFGLHCNVHFNMAPQTLLIFCDGTGMDGTLAPPSMWLLYSLLPESMPTILHLESTLSAQDNPQVVLGGEFFNLSSQCAMRLSFLLTEDIPRTLLL